MIKWLKRMREERGSNLFSDETMAVLSAKGLGAVGNENQQTATRVAAVYACIKVLSETLGSVPLKLYQRNKDGTRGVVANHFLSKVSARSPTRK